MRNIRAYLENIEAGKQSIPGAEAHHIIHVLRMQAGQELELFDGRGMKACGVIEEVGRGWLSVMVSGVERTEARKRGRIIIASSIAKGHRFEQVITQCTELGADAVMPVIFERTVKQPKGKSVLDRYTSLAVSASKQCGRDFLPSITEPVSFEETVNMLKAGYSEAVYMYGGFSGSSVDISKVDADGKDVVVFVGPEGGITEAEEKLLEGMGGIEVSINKNVLRTETAAAAFVSILAARRSIRQV